MTSSLSLIFLLTLAAKPVARPYQGPLDAIDVKDQSAGVLTRFLTADRGTAEATLTDVSRALGLTHTLRVSFIRTGAGPLAAAVIEGEPQRLPFSRYTELARRLSAQPGVLESWAFVSPGPRDDSLEGEAWFRFEHGEPAGAQRAQYRDDARYVEHLRKKTPLSNFHAARWPDYPLSKLAQTLQLPGRSCLDLPWQLQTLASLRWPIDAGDNLGLAWVDLPGGVATEIQQLALKEQRSPSSVVAEALTASRAQKKLAAAPDHTIQAPYDEGQPDAEKLARRSMTLFLPSELIEAAEDSGGAEAVSLSRVVQYAWRRAHPQQQ
ncbi:MAG: hypothetical protein IPJ65_34065 [Archangiaceae bacterium]|nr:hypothetical protein [Archangiaceae bacterium]